MNLQDLPQPTVLTDAEFLENLRVVMNATINALRDNPARITDVRNGDIGLIVHSAGIELILKEPDDPIAHAAHHMVEELSEELNRVFDESQEEE